jgi:5'-phosphate synthase pdxT subunit
VLALQGAFREHREVLESLGVAVVEVREAHELDAVELLVLPGGESTTMSRLLDTSGLREPVADRLRAGMPVLGTCAGLILLARDVVDGRPDQRSFGVLDVRARRNAYGRQAESFEAPLEVPGLGGATFPGVFIRAPGVDEVGAGVDVLASHDDRPVLVREGTVWASSFHPELSGDLRIHQWFLREAGDERERSAGRTAGSTGRSGGEMSESGVLAGRPGARSGAAGR